MSVRLIGKDVTIVVPDALISCDGPCRRSWSYAPNVIHFQEADAWRNSPDHYAVTLRHVVGIGVRHPKEITEGKHLCPECLVLVTDVERLALVLNLDGIPK